MHRTREHCQNSFTDYCRDGFSRVVGVCSSTQAGNARRISDSDLNHFLWQAPLMQACLKRGCFQSGFRNTRLQNTAMFSELIWLMWYRCYSDWHGQLAGLHHSWHSGSRTDIGSVCNCNCTWARLLLRCSCRHEWSGIRNVKRLLVQGSDTATWRGLSRKGWVNIEVTGLQNLMMCGLQVPLRMVMIVNGSKASIAVLIERGAVMAGKSCIAVLCDTFVMYQGVMTEPTVMRVLLCDVPCS